MAISPRLPGHLTPWCLVGSTLGRHYRLDSYGGTILDTSEIHQINTPSPPRRAGTMNTTNKLWLLALGHYTANDEPQPQVVLALGLRITN